jgi:peptide/nickel transport system substrate-binding protein
MKRYCILVLLLCFCLVAASCAGGTSQGSVPDPGTPAPSSQAAPGQQSSASPKEPKYQKTITIAPALDFTGMDVQNEAGGTAKSVFLMVFDLLVMYDTTNSEYVPGLAESWTQLSDTSWEFKLRKGVKFHDGSDFTANDVKFTIDRGMTMGASSSKFASIQEVTVVDPHTVRLDLKTPDNDLIYKLAEPNTVILSANAFSTMSAEEATKIGTGAYKYNQWVQGDYLSLIRNEDYWGGVKKTEEIVIRYIPEASSRLIALQTGEIDYCIDPPAVDLHYIAEDSSLKLWQIPSSNIRHIIMNFNVEPFNNKQVRQAVAHALNREDLIAFVYEGNATPAYNIMHPTSEFYVNVPYYEFDLDKARALLEQAGYPNGFATTIYSSSGTVQKAVGSVVQAQLAEIGIQVEIQALETATFNAGVAPGGTYPMAVDGWGGHMVGPDNALRNPFHSKGNINRSNIKDPYVDELIDKALGTLDYDERTALYAEIQEYIMDLANWIPLAVEQINVGVKANLEGFELPHALAHRWYNLYIMED